MSIKSSRMHHHRTNIELNIINKYLKLYLQKYLPGNLMVKCRIYFCLENNLLNILCIQLNCIHHNSKTVQNKPYKSSLLYLQKYLSNNQTNQRKFYFYLNKNLLNKMYIHYCCMTHSQGNLMYIINKWLLQYQQKYWTNNLRSPHKIYYLIDKNYSSIRCS